MKSGNLVTAVPFCQFDDGSYSHTALEPNQIRLIRVISCPSPVWPNEQMHCINARPAGHPLGPERRYDDGEMHIRIAHVDITTCQSDYTTLSYCWGGEANSRVVFVHDLESTETAILTVTASLYGALQRAQYALTHDLEVDEKTSVSALLWADGICIRQDWDKEDNVEDEVWSAEKSQQVLMMGRIYENAISCLIDLGDDAQDSHLISKFGPVLVNAINLVGRRHGQIGTIRSSELATYGLPYLDDPLWMAWARFLTRPWFRRVWIVQEYVLSAAGAFMYGSLGESLPFNFLPLTAKNLERMGLGQALYYHVEDRLTVEDARSAVDSENALTNLALFRVKMEHGIRPTLLDGLKNAHSLQATDLRDKFYSLLGMCAPLDKADPDLHVDYSRRTTPDQVSLRFTRYILRNDPNAVEILYYRPDAAQQPSWLPDWTGTLGNRMQTIKQFRNTVQIFRAGGDGQCMLAYNPGSETISCEGYILDEVADLSPIFILGNVHALLAWEKNARNWVMQMWQSPDQRPCNAAMVHRHASRTKLEEVYANVLVADNPPIEVGSHPRYGSTQTLYQEMTGLLDNYATATGASNQNLIKYTTHIQRVVQRRRLCVTTQGRLGLVPGRTRALDQLILLKGAVMPFAMRTRQPPRGTSSLFELLGGAYVDGAMYGEAARDISSSSSRGSGSGWTKIIIQ